MVICGYKLWYWCDGDGGDDRDSGCSGCCYVASFSLPVLLWQQRTQATSPQAVKHEIFSGCGNGVVGWFRGGGFLRYGGD